MMSSLTTLLLIFFALAATKVFAATTVSVSATASHAIPTSLFGMMFEDISSGDGGLYGELLQNRAFQQVDLTDESAALTAWIPIGTDASISVIADPSPLSSALPNSLVLTIPANATGEVGFANQGYWGINFEAGKAYTASLYYRLPASSAAHKAAPPILTISLQAADGTRLASHSTPLTANSTGGWTHISAVLTPSRTPPSTANLFVVTVDHAAASAAASEVEVHFALLSLFPPTFKGRANGMRVDIAEALAEVRPAFWRFPGGNNLEGQTPATRWQWRNTVGPLTERPGRMGDWGYVNTDGLGLLEYLYWCEDMEMEPFMAVWDGYTLDGNSVTGAALEPYIAEAIEQILFVIGDPKTSEPAALRASLGRPEPFALTYIEVGNEDFFGSTTVASRWNEMVTNLTATFPQLQFMATSDTSGPVLTPTPKHYDIHVYQTPDWFATNSNFYDSFERNGSTYFEGEYAAISSNASNLFGTPDQGRFLWPTMAGSAGEAAFMMGFERNADIVFAASYAPLLGHVNDSQWTPNLVGFDAGNVIKSTSFYTQKLFSLNKGDEYLPSTLPDANGTLFWSVTRWKSTGELIIKISNTATTPADLTFVLPFKNVARDGSAQVLTGTGSESNTPEEPNLVVPKTIQIPTGSTFDYTAPAISVSVITLNAR